ncbi:FapA family protein [Chitinispirillales bacterium ANBcel5]|uniref:DUF342 domain-containing protein n=1 Tax=Cellulosispirillum alkaliphilum TaxID=3039283 RepID=UPI002A58F380|nr:FapA family protein [Chitinispirillales bacterium ANBcel5]
MKSEKLEIRIIENGLKAKITSLCTNISIDEIKEALKQNAVVNGVQWDHIELSLHKAQQFDAAIADVIVADCTPAYPYTIQLGDKSEPIYGEQVQVFLNNLSNIFFACSENDERMQIEGGIFVNSDEKFLEYSYPEEINSVLGKTASFSPQRNLFNGFHSIYQKKNKNKVSLIAEKTGFLVINEKDELMIIDPCVVSANKLEMYFLVMPLIYGRQQVYDKLFRTSGSGDLTENDLHNMMKTKRLQKVLVRKGTPPKKGKEGLIDFKIDMEVKPVVNDKGQVNFRDISRYTEVSEGTVIAQKRPPVQSVPGVDVFGKVIPVEKVVEIDLKAGENVNTVEDGDEILFVASQTGILNYKNDSISISPELVLRDGVSLETGNIKFSRDVRISNNVQSGFTVECGGDLIIYDSIEDNVQITCRGNLIVKKGIFGEKTKVRVSGDAKVRFIQNSNIRVKGNLVVEEFIYHSKVFCDKSITVKGHGIVSNEKGCVVGGQVASNGNIELHSLGSQAALSTVVCGSDPETVEKLEELNAFSNVLKKKVVGIQGKLGAAINSPRMKKNLKNLPEEKKKALKNELNELKKTLDLNNKTNESIERLKKVAFSSDPENLKVTIKRHLVPQVLININQKRRKVMNQCDRVNFLYKDGEIVMAPLSHE